MPDPGGEYCPFYCEENVWRRARARARPTDEVLVISNPTRTVLLFGQRAGDPTRGYAVVWDYHVILLDPVADRAEGGRVHDVDCIAGPQLPLSTYLAFTFPVPLDEQFAPRFRVVAAPDFVATLVSDRGHMRDERGAFTMPPPSWPPPGEGAPNLFDFVDVTGPGPGDVIDLSALRARVGGPHE